MSAKLRDAKNMNYRLQVKYLEATSGQKLNIILPDRRNPVLMEIDLIEEEVCYVL